MLGTAACSWGAGWGAGKQQPRLGAGWGETSWPGSGKAPGAGNVRPPSPLPPPLCSACRFDPRPPASSSAGGGGGEGGQGGCELDDIGRPPGTPHLSERGCWAAHGSLCLWHLARQQRGNRCPRGGSTGWLWLGSRDPQSPSTVPEQSGERRQPAATGSGGRGGGCEARCEQSGSSRVSSTGLAWCILDQLGAISQEPRGATAELPAPAGAVAGRSFSPSSAWARAVKLRRRAGTAIRAWRGRDATRRAAQVGRDCRASCMFASFQGRCKKWCDGLGSGRKTPEEGEGTSLRFPKLASSDRVSRRARKGSDPTTNTRRQRRRGCKPPWWPCGRAPLSTQALRAPPAAGGLQ